MKILSEIIFEIFLRIPVKSLMLFKCISKFCNSLIGSNSVFKDAHGRHYSMTRPTFLIHEWESVYTAEQIKDWKARGFFDRLVRGCGEFVVRPRVMCANGLFCLWNEFVQPAVICNPSTREVRFLPQLNIVSKYIMFLLGFDPEENKYKILMSAKLGDEKYSSSYELLRVPARNWVFTLGIDESWREINNTTVSFCQRIDNEICIGGVIYQLNYVISDHSGWNILAFNVKDENFRIIPLWTSPIHDPLRHNYMLTEVKGKLAVIVFNKVLDMKDMDLWILGKMDGEWEKHIIAFPLLWFKDLPFTRMCFCFRTHHEGEIVVAASMITKLERREDRKFLYLCYDVTTKCWREFESQGLPVHGLIDRIHVYAESLVSLIKSSDSPCLTG